MKINKISPERFKEKPAIRFSLFLFICLLSLFMQGGALFPEAPSRVNFDDHFLDKALRINFHQVGDAEEEKIIIRDIYEEPIWPGSKTQLVNPFNYGHYFIKVYEISSNKLIYAQGFDCMFGEYRTTAPALNGIKRVFKRAVRIPYPRRPVNVVFEVRDKKNILHPLSIEKVDPEDYHIIKENNQAGDFIFEVQKKGEPHSKVDLVFIAEGYTAEDKEKFIDDATRFTDVLFSTEPYKSSRDKFNVYGVFRPSAERGPDEPRQGVYKNTALNASFNAFDLDRYMLTEEGILLREIAGQVPYDTIVVLVNSKRYGGGGIYNDYCITTVDHFSSKRVFLHEFGHSFAGLADEYYASEVTYNEFYPRGVEPLEPNITALLDPENVKWKDLLSPGLEIPTEYGKEELDKLQAEIRKTQQEMRQAVEDAKKKNVGEADIEKIKKKYQKKEEEIKAKIKKIREKYKDLEDKVGVFEGAGYSSEGLYRPMIYCLMISSPTQEFCKVCRQAIKNMIDYYTR